MSSDLSESYQIVTKNRGQTVGQNVLSLTGGEVLLSVEEPSGDLEFGRFSHNVNNALELLSSQVSSALLGVNASFLQHQGRKTTTNTLDGSKGIDDVNGTINLK